MAQILLIDDDKDLGRFLSAELREHGYSVDYVDSGERGLDLLNTGPVDLILLDYRMPRMNGIEFLTALKRRAEHPPVIMMTMEGTSDATIQAFLLGVSDYIEKGLDIDEFVERLEPKILTALSLQFTNHSDVPIDQEPDVAGGPQLLGKCDAMLEVYRAIGQVAQTDKPVLIQGETGTGKELVARAIHNHSSRGDYCALNVAALTESLLESELFGHEKGAYTGADVIRKGYFERASGGTLFLDEIGEMPFPLQANLLRVVETQEVLRIGGSQPIQLDVRLISATHQNLEEAIEKNKFREDLYYRLNVFPISLPPLRERGSDLRLLGRYYLVTEAAKALKPVPTLHASAIEVVRAHSWPGNVRELKDRITRAVLKCRGTVIMPDDLGLPDKAASNQPSLNEIGALRQAVECAWKDSQGPLWSDLHDKLECELLRFAHDELNGNQTKMAERLGMVRNTIRARLLKYGLLNEGS